MCIRDSVIDTVIYINAGKIEKVYDISFTVKVPTGMKEADLARPVVEVRDFTTGKLEYEIYTYGEENVVMPVKSKEKESPIEKLAREVLYKEFSRYDPRPEIEFTSEDRITVRVRSEAVASLIGKKGKNIDRLEKKLGISISVEPKDGLTKRETDWDYEERGKSIVITISPEYIGKEVDIYKGDEYICSACVGKKGKIKIKKKSEFGRRILQAIIEKKLRVLV